MPLTIDPSKDSGRVRLKSEQKLPMIDETLQFSETETVAWLHDELVRPLVRLCVVVGVVWYMYLGLVLEVVDLRQWSSALVLVLTGVLAWRLQKRPRLASMLLVVGTGAAVLAAAWALQDERVLLLLALPVGLCGLLFHPYAGVVAGVVAGAALLPLGMLGVPAALAVFAMAGVVWLATVPQRMLMRWAVRSSLRAEAQTAEAREHRGELVRLVKQLNAANQQLNAMMVELERARSAANEARRLKAEFAANISHELRTPLNLIIGFSDMMVLAPESYGAPLPEAYREDLQTIYRNAKHLSALVDDVLDLSQIEAGRMGLVKAPLHLAEVVQEAMNTVAALYANRGLTLRADLPQTLPVVEADRTRLRQVLLNLLGNAVRFTRQGGVTITASADEQMVTVCVTDTGPGIPAEKLPHLFQEFSQIDGTIHYQSSSGLGLAISKQFIELHGGTMGAQSVEGEGTTFSFTLPQRTELALSSSPPGWETWVRLRNRGERVVAVLAPNPAVVRLFARYLDAYRVIAVSNVEDAWQLATRQVIHALIAVAPAGERSWPLLRNMRESLPNLPVIVCTLRGGSPELNGSAALPDATTYLSKPVSQEDLLRALAALDDAPLGDRSRAAPYGDRGDASAKRTLLIVDDEPEIVRLLTRMVEAAPDPYHVVRAANGREALALLQKVRPHALVLDLLMPEIDGYTVLEHVRADAQLCNVPVIVISAKGRVEETVTAGLVGISRRDGLSLGETMRCLKANLDALQPPPQPGAPQSPSTGSTAAPAA